MRASLPCPWAEGGEKKQACAKPRSRGVAPEMVFRAPVSWKDKPLQRFRWQSHGAFGRTLREKPAGEKVHWRGKTSTGPLLPVRRTRPGPTSLGQPVVRRPHYPGLRKMTKSGSAPLPQHQARQASKNLPKCWAAPLPRTPVCLCCCCSGG